MATGCSFLSEDQFLCAICLEVFTEPVSIPCGHNFCKACINRHWEDKEQCQCPLCNERFNKGFKLRVNTGFREVVENFKEHHAKADNNSLAKPGQVPCDCCLANKFKASKTCLVCLTSYCETHLEPHLRVAALKRHKLTDPVYNLEDQICKKHNRMFELFCRNDQTCVCVLCTEHSSHDTVRLEEAFVDKRAQMGKKKAEVQESKRRRGKKGQKTKEAVQTKRKGIEKAMSNCVVPNQMQAPLIWWIPNQFDSSAVPGNRDVSEGRFYHEVQAEGFTSWNLGVVREPMHGIRRFIPNSRNGNWVIRLGTDANCKARSNIPVHFFWIKEPKRVTVLVDFDDGLVLFYDADTGILAHTFICCNFIDMVYLFYCPSPDSWAHRLQKKVQKIKAQIPDTVVIFCCIIFYFVLVSFMSIV
ncbi:E3 ubiquitin/ISG15 ligase TRIM25-like [Anarrhichthys ocellatus]|uniref:E3 ubiquitin/ISG15 ligase TRIM25-like n=1 Tax=Anarrhichthys ocellatus TaxID=433405 RepID=UPI0012EE9015|nr:E3 ubiquitin/ISG15 ligase TRIM25-like [Anarrhichthys ocellatus]XP_031708737.1 E3 ubiquitin/ISG15 ligase TRIM25-like [Anarrhichthys ocellatus]XP_031708739.1 E3 ubiquitin/ISG15 ligase TRIM25-like [Anarrhichthys ocellatus]